ncbi:MAG: DUF885 domain-containing protein [Microbacteriaceae bacterium]|nr:DUF885 domain-containing protein [Microbacteriaceae bacterium]
MTREPSDLDLLAEDWVQKLVELSPDFATYAGFKVGEDKLEDTSPEAGAEYNKLQKEMLAKVEATPVRDEIDKVTKLAMTSTLKLSGEIYDSGLWRRDLNPIASPAQGIRDIFDLSPTATVENWENISKRMLAVDNAVNGYIETLREGIKHNDTPAIRQIKLAITQAEQLLTPDGFFRKFAANAEATEGSIPDSLKAELLASAEAATESYAKLTNFFKEVPGHHLQIAQKVYNKADLNSWRRLASWSSGHGEGWALYAERLMQELGFLDDPGDRLGMLDGQRMRAARVVLDIGVHLGKPRLDGTGKWDFDYALDFMSKNVNMSEQFINFEVHRYFGWPGQAPSYKIGQRIWEQIRDEYKVRQGANFNIKEFHMKALNLGSIGLDTLETALLG